MNHQPTEYERVNSEMVALLHQMSVENDPKTVEALDKQVQQKMNELTSLMKLSSR